MDIYFRSAPSNYHFLLIKPKFARIRLPIAIYFIMCPNRYHLKEILQIDCEFYIFSRNFWIEHTGKRNERTCIIALVKTVQNIDTQENQPNVRTKGKWWDLCGRPSMVNKIMDDKLDKWASNHIAESIWISLHVLRKK